MPEKLYASDIGVDKQSITQDLSGAEENFTSTDVTDVHNQAQKLTAQYEKKLITTVKEKFGLDLTNKQGMTGIDGKYSDLANKMSEWDKATKAIDDDISAWQSRDAIITQATEKMKTASGKILATVNTFISQHLEKKNKVKTEVEKSDIEITAAVKKTGAPTAVDIKNDSNGFLQSLEFTGDSVKPRIDEVLDVHNIDASKVLTIDYSQMTRLDMTNYLTRHGLNPQIKTFTIKQGKDYQGNNTYVLCDKTGKKTNARALIYPGVQIRSEKTDARVQFDQIETQENQQKETTKETQQQEQQLFRTYNIDALNQSLDTPLNQRQSLLFLKKLDVRKTSLKQALQDKKYTKPAPGEPLLSKNYTTPGVLFDVEYVDETGNTEDMPLFDKKTLGPELYDLIDDHEDEFLQWLMPLIDDVYYTPGSEEHVAANTNNTSNKQNQTNTQTDTPTEILQKPDPMDIARSEPWMSETVNQRANDEVDTLITEMMENNIVPGSDKPFHDARGGLHVLEFDVAGSPMDHHIFDFGGKRRTKQNKTNEQQNALKALMEQGGNNDKLIHYMNTVFAKKRAAKNLESSKESRQKTIDERQKMDASTLQNTLGKEIDKYTQRFADEAGLFGDIDEADKITIRKHEELITSGLALLKNKSGNDLKEYNSLMSRFVDIQSGIGTDDADASETSLFAGEADRRLEFAIANIDSQLADKNPTQQVDLYRDKMVAIALNSSQSETFKKSKQYIDALGAKIGANIKDARNEDPDKKDDKKEQLFRLIQMMRDEGRGSEEVNEYATNQLNKNKDIMDEDQAYTYGIHNDFKNYPEAKKLMHWMMTEGGVADTLSHEALPVGKGQEQRKDTDSSQRQSLLCEKIGRPSSDGQETILTAILGTNYEKILTKDYNNLSLQQRVNLDAIMTMADRRMSFDSYLSENNDDPSKAVSAYMASMQNIVGESSSRLMDQYADNLDNTVPDGATGINAEILTAFNDMHGVGWFNLTDKNTEQALIYADMGGGFAVALVATLVAIKTAGAASPAAIAAWGALGGSLGGVLYEGLRGRGYENLHDGLMDISTTMATEFAVTLGTLGLGRGLGTLGSRISRGTARLLKGGSKTTTIANKAKNAGRKTFGAETVRDFGVETPLGLYVEQQRQKVILGQSVTLEQMVSEMGPLMGIMAAMKINEMPKSRLGGKNVKLNVEADRQALLEDIGAQIKALCSGPFPCTSE